MRNIISIRILFLIIVFSIFAVSSYTDGNTYAQNARTFATGTVVDEQGQPIPGVNVLCQNSNYGTPLLLMALSKFKRKVKIQFLNFRSSDFKNKRSQSKIQRNLLR
mgnify:CR=1 FL=1